MRNVRSSRSPGNSQGKAGWKALALGAVALGCLPLAAWADDTDPTDVGLEREVARATAPPTPTESEAPSPVLLRLRVGEARFVRDLARVDVQLELKNTSGRIVEWTQEFPMDPKAEVIACALQRADQVILSARSLTFEDGRRIYDETVRPAPRTPNPGKDPLLVQRPADGRLSVSVFPLGPDESVRVLLSFVTSLADRGHGRRYHDPLWLRPVGDRAVARPAPATTLFVQPGALVLAKADDVFLVQTLSPERLLVQPATATAALAPAQLRFEAPVGALPALTVPGGGLGTRVAYWHLDPKSMLAERGITAVPEQGATLRFTARGAAARLVPAEINASAPPVTMSARHSPNAGPLVYDVELVGVAQPQRWTVTHPTEVLGADADLIDAVGAWYRAQLARHVLAWSASWPERRAKALAYAVDLGVVLPGTCALALPAAEQRTLSRPSRRLYRTDGTEIGDPSGDADWTAPPQGSFR